MARNKVTYYDRPNKDQSRREGPQDAMQAYQKWKQENPERRLTFWGWKIIRKEQSSRDRTAKD